MKTFEAAHLAASCLSGERPPRSISEADVRYWAATDLLLPICDILERRVDRTLALLPDASAAMVDDVRRAAAASEAGERHVIGQVLIALGEAGVVPLLLKGAALSYTVYREPWLRARSDVDLLIPPGVMERVAQALQPLGFEAAREVCHPLVTRQRHFIRDVVFRVAIDIHETLVNPPVLRTLPEYDILVERAQALPGLSASAKALGTADALLHALVHRVAHHNSSVDLLWLYDMHLLVARMGAADWTLLVDTARTSRVCRIALDGLQLLAATLQTDVPDIILSELAQARGEPSAALLGGALTEWRLQWINWRSLRGASTRIEFVRAHLTPPAGELSFGTQPTWRLPSHYLVRAVRGARKWLAPISRAR